MLELNEVLVPVDLSPASYATFARAREMLTGESPVVVLLYVISPELVAAASSAGFGSAATIRRKLRVRAQAELDRMAADSGHGGVEVTALVAEGVPFYEIARHADELDVDAVVIGKSGAHDNREVLFFGSTAEKVVRASRKPVIVLSAQPVMA